MAFRKKYKYVIYRLGRGPYYRKKFCFGLKLFFQYRPPIWQITYIYYIDTDIYARFFRVKIRSLIFY